MGTTNSPYGLRPVNILGGQPASNAARWYPMTSNETTPIFAGDAVVFITTSTGRGTIRRMNTTVTATTVTSSGNMLGVFAGCEYTDPVSGQKLQRQYYPGAIVASDIRALIYDDPDQLFQIRADGSVAQTKQGCNGAMIQTAVGNTLTQTSGLSLQASSLDSTTTLPLRVYDFVSTVGDSYTDVLVRFNNHFHRQLTGVAAS